MSDRRDSGPLGLAGVSRASVPRMQALSQLLELLGGTLDTGRWASDT